jgi:hypothetical protein
MGSNFSDYMNSFDVDSDWMIKSNIVWINKYYES